MAEKMYTPITPTNTAPPVLPDAPTRPSLVVGMSIRDLLRLVLAGLSTGIVTMGVALAANRYIFGVVLCRNSGGDCTQAPLYALIVAIVVGGILGTVLLARLRIYRPMFVVLATIIALWGVHFWLFGAAWYLALVVAAALYALAYGAFAWVARIRSFLLSLALTVGLVVLIRLLA